MADFEELSESNFKMFCLYILGFCRSHRHVTTYYLVHFFSEYFVSLFLYLPWFFSLRISKLLLPEPLMYSVVCNWGKNIPVLSVTPLDSFYSILERKAFDVLLNVIY